LLHLLAVVLIPWSDIATDTRPAERGVTVVVHRTSAIELHANQRYNGDAIVELTPSLAVERRVSDSYWQWHQRLERQGRLTHDRRTLSVSLWSATAHVDAGWDFVLMRGRSATSQRSGNSQDDLS
jgi:hypothetical protein